MPLLVVTGQIGAGKSSLCAELQKLGAVVVSADELVHRLYATDEQLLTDIEAAVARPLRHEDGTLDRKLLAAAIFENDRLRQTVEALVHPRVRGLLSEALSEHPDDLIVYDVPLWPARDSALTPDWVVEVAAPIEIRMARLVDRGMDVDDAQRRVNLQLSQSRGAVDETINNGSSAEQLAEHAQDLWRRFGVAE